MSKWLISGYVSLLLSRLPKFPNQCDSDGMDSLDIQGSNKEIELQEGAWILV